MNFIRKNLTTPGIVITSFVTIVLMLAPVFTPIVTEYSQVFKDNTNIKTELKESRIKLIDKYNELTKLIK